LKIANGPRGIAILTGRQTTRPFDLRAADFDKTGRVDFADFVMFVLAFDTSSGDVGYHSKFDLNGDDAVNFGDFWLFVQAFEKDLDP
jgi:hypothetical protein